VSDCIGTTFSFFLFLCFNILLIFVFLCSDEDYSVLMLECDLCHMWVHIECDDITKMKYKAMASAHDIYHCRVCRAKPRWLAAMADQLKVYSYLYLKYIVCDKLLKQFFFIKKIRQL
jgi:hypothetical protein